MRVWGWGREQRLLGLLATVCQHLGREMMPVEHPTDPPVVFREVIRLLDNPSQLAISQGVRDGQQHEVLLDVTRQERFDRGFAPWCGSLR